MSISNYNKVISKERIKNDMLKVAAKVWGYAESEMTTFDPLVEILLGACAKEFEKVSQEIHESRKRVLNRLAHLMTPDVLMSPRPAHAILHARTVEPMSVIDPETQFYIQKLIPARIAHAKDKSKDIFFTPTGRFKIFDGNLNFMFHENNLFQFLTPLQKEEVGEETDRLSMQKLPASVLWLGIELKDSLKTLEGLSFFFDWKNTPEKNDYYEQLPQTQWSVNGKPLIMKTAYSEDMSYKFQDEFNISKTIEHQVNEIYKPAFLTVEQSPDISKADHQNYPPIFARILPAESLKVLKDKMIWLKVQFPVSMPENAIRNCYPAINCLPVINRKLEAFSYRLSKRKTGKQETSQENLSIIPLKTNDYFFDIIHVHDSHQEKYLPINPLASLGSYEPNTYILRKGGINRYDSREANDLISYLLDLLKDESNAFAALDRDIISKEISNIRTALERLKNKVPNIYHEPITYLMVNSQKKGEDVHIKFWSTNGDLPKTLNRIRIPAGSRLIRYKGLAFHNESIMLLTEPFGGRNQLSPQENQYTYKEAIMTRGHITSAEDIKAICKSLLGRQLTNIKVKRGFKIDINPQNGLIKTIDVQLTLSQFQNTNTDEWNWRLNELKATLENKLKRALDDELLLKYPVRIIWEKDEAQT